MSNVEHVNPAWRVRSVVDIAVVHDPQWAPKARIVDAGTEGTVDPFSLGQKTVVVSFDGDDLPPYATRAVLVPASAVEAFHPDLTAGACDPQGTRAPREE